MSINGSKLVEWITEKGYATCVTDIDTLTEAAGLDSKGRPLKKPLKSSLAPKRKILSPTKAASPVPMKAVIKKPALKRWSAEGWIGGAVFKQTELPSTHETNDQ